MQQDCFAAIINLINNNNKSYKALVSRKLFTALKYDQGKNEW